MRKSLVAISLGLIVEFGAGCQHTNVTASPFQGNTVTTRVASPSTKSLPMECYATPYSQEIISGDSADIELTMENMEPYVLLTGETEWSTGPWYIEVTLDGASIGYSEQGRSLERQHADESWSIIGLAPGNRIKALLPVSALFDLSKPGKYEFKCSRKFWRRGDTRSVFICSARATIRVGKVKRGKETGKE